MISKLPKDLAESLKEYLQKDEKVYDALEEVYVLRFDFRWTVLTNERIIVATKRILDYNFKDYPLNILDIDVDLGFFFDILEFRMPSKVYTAHFYSFNRNLNLKFFHEIEKKLREVRLNEKVDDNDYKVADKLRDLKKLYQEEIITKEEYNEKKKELLKRL